MEKEKLLIGLPNATGDTKNEWSAMLAQICTHLALNGYNLEIICVDGSFIDAARNKIIEIANEMNVDWVFFLDDDTYIDYDGVYKMIQLDKDIASPPVADRKGGKHLNVLNAGLNRVNSVDKTSEVTAIGMACTLIKGKVIKDMLKEYAKPFEFSVVHYNDKPIEVGEDVNFCLRAKQKFGYETWVIKGVQTKHEGNPIKYTYEG